MTTFESDEERKRAERNGRLLASDWAMVEDAPVDKAAWRRYRQALRDLPLDPNWPNVDLPKEPDQ